MVLADAGNDVVVHARRKEIADAINTRHENPDYLPGTPLLPSLKATSDPAVALAEADVAVISIPAQTLRANLTGWAPHIGADTLVVSLMKGVETSTGLRMSEVITQVTEVPPARVAVLSGPNLARESAARQPAAPVIAAPDEKTAEQLQEASQTGYFRPYTNTDGQVFGADPLTFSGLAGVGDLVATCSSPLS
ncbi:hypothetical protein GCM10010252_73160 [Streptomyces aureoverticillatus]|nr:hypothetical protein GCM10010252_73160 [Streptomyces aureoverticillatus]